MLLFVFPAFSFSVLSHFSRKIPELPPSFNTLSSSKTAIASLVSFPRYLCMALCGQELDPVEKAAFLKYSCPLSPRLTLGRKKVHSALHGDRTDPAANPFPRPRPPRAEPPSKAAVRAGPRARRDLRSIQQRRRRRQFAPGAGADHSRLSDTAASELAPTPLRSPGARPPAPPPGLALLPPTPPCPPRGRLESVVTLPCLLTALHCSGAVCKPRLLSSSPEALKKARRPRTEDARSRDRMTPPGTPFGCGSHGSLCDYSG